MKSSNTRESAGDLEWLESAGDLLSNCCGADFDAFGFPRGDGLYDEKCLKCGKLCDVSWQETLPSQQEMPKPKFISQYKERVKDFGKALEDEYHPVQPPKSNECRCDKYLGIMNPTCKVHEKEFKETTEWLESVAEPKSSEWEKEFDEQFKIGVDQMAATYASNVKDFIRKALTQQEKELRAIVDSCHYKEAGTYDYDCIAEKVLELIK